MKNVFIVTGANRGIGLEVVRTLGLQTQETDSEVYLTSRDPALGEAALKDLKEKYGLKNVYYEQCDVSNDESVLKFASRMSTKQDIHIAALINNAGFGWDIFGESLTPELAESIMQINYFGPARMIKFLRPLMDLSPGGTRVINVSSDAGVLKKGRYSNHVISALTDENATCEEIDAMAREFLASVRNSSSSPEWPRDAYRSSKALLNAYSRALAKEFEKDSVFVAAVCPGWVRTRMGGNAAPRSVEQGADTIVWLATATGESFLQHSGKFWQDRRQIKTVM